MLVAVDILGYYYEQPEVFSQVGAAQSGGENADKGYTD